jgi:hypothetical protein
LKAIAKRVFSQDVSIDVKLVADGPGAQELAANGAATASGAEKPSDLVNETLRIFPGSAVRSVRREGG